jgi:hypothetical protein
MQKLAGHRDLGTTQQYMHLSPLAIEAAIRLLELPPSAAERSNMSATPEAGEEVVLRACNKPQIGPITKRWATTRE